MCLEQLPYSGRLCSLWLPGRPGQAQTGRPHGGPRVPQTLGSVKSPRWGPALEGSQPSDKGRTTTSPSGNMARTLFLCFLALWPQTRFRGASGDHRLTSHPEGHGQS